MSNISHVLSAIERGDPTAAEQLLPLVYEELRRLACPETRARAVGADAPTDRAGPRGLHPAGGGGPPNGWDGRGHFFAAAAEAMRRILVERARRKGRIHHGGGLRRVDLLEADAEAPTEDGQVLLLDEALTRLAAARPLPVHGLELSSSGPRRTGSESLLPLYSRLRASSST